MRVPAGDIPPPVGAVDADRLAVEARRAAEAGDHARAVALFDRALSDPDCRDGADLRREAAESSGMLGRHAEAVARLAVDERTGPPANRAALAEACQLSEDVPRARRILAEGTGSADARWLVEWERQAAECRLLEGDATGALRSAEEALRRRTLGGRLRVRLLDLCGRARLAGSEFAGAADSFAAAARGAAGLGDPRLEIRAVINESICRLRMGEHEAAARGFRDAAYSASMLGFRREEAIAAENVAVLEHYRRRYAPALADYRRALALLDAQGNPEYVARVAHNLGELLLRLGDPVGAAEQADFADRTTAKAGAASPALRGEAALLRTRIALALGRTEEAEGTLAEARAAYADTDEPARQAEIAVLEAQRLARDGHGDEAHDRIRGRTPLLARFPRHHAEALLTAADLLLARGSDPTASLQRARETAERLEDDELLWRIDFRFALHALELHRLDEARRTLDRAERVADRIRTAAPAEYLGRLDRMPERAGLKRLARRLEAAETAAAPPPRPVGPGEDRPSPWVADSAASRSLVDRAGRVAAGDWAVLLTGETGTGKDRLARWIHDHSPRRNGPFVKCSCGAIAEDLFLGELLGHERGAFTGAADRRAGWFEAAAGGTLFLDDVSEAPSRIQAVILRVIEERRLTRLGGTEAIPIDARVICATNRSIDAMVERGAFRRELFYLLRPFRLHLAPLRERPEDALAIAEAFVRRTGTPGLDADARRLIETHPWPGNVRELENALRAAAALAAGRTLCAADLRGTGALGPASDGGEARRIAERLTAEIDDVLEGRRSLTDVTDALEGRIISRALERSGGNVAAAARLLGVPRSRLSRTARRLGIRADEPALTREVKS